MNVELPQTRPYDALFVVGTRLTTGTVETIGTIIVKAGYLLTASGGADTHAMTPDPAPAGSALVLADQATPVTDGVDVSREADIAPYKPLADIAVEGFRAGLDINGAEIRIDDTIWLTRVDDINQDGTLTAADVAGLSAPSVNDRNRHLFGYQPRTESPRQDDAKAAANTTPKSLAEFSHYANGFLNFHRRGGGFAASAAIGSAVQQGQRVTVRKAGATALSVTLPIPSLTALYRTWCGDGPDKAPYWTRKSLGPMRADTLILRPDSGKAEVIWRATWHWVDEPADSYRSIRVTEGTV